MGKHQKLILTGFFIFGLIGFLDSTFLTFQHYNQAAPSCYIFSGCDNVLSSRFATVAGIPISLAGAFYYLAILIATVLYFDTGGSIAFRALTLLPFFGFAASLYLLFLQLFVIKYTCFYCIVSLISSSAIFALALILARKRSV